VGAGQQKARIEKRRREIRLMERERERERGKKGEREEGKGGRGWEGGDRGECALEHERDRGGAFVEEKSPVVW